MAEGNDAVRLYLTYEGGYVDAVIEENGVKKPYDGNFKNDSGMDPHEYCAKIADDIERDIGKSVRWSMSEPKRDWKGARARRLEMEERYATDFSMSSDPYELATTHDGRLAERIEDASERVKAFPNDKDEHETLVWLYNEERIMWEACESRLRKDANETEGENKTQIARKINSAHEKVIEYTNLYNAAIASMVNNTSKLNKAGRSMQRTGDALQGAGDSMKSAGHSMTIGIVVPIIVILLLVLLFMILF